MKQLLLLLLLPAFVCGQEVTPVISNDYLSLIDADSLQVKGFWPDTTNSIKLSPLLINNNYFGFKVRKIRVQQGIMTIYPYWRRSIWVSGQFSTGVEIKRINQLPALQSQFVQGRPENGAPVWRGPETGELFSYGPAINTLEYGGSNYAYDNNGRLVAAGTGNGKAANIYNNNIFRTASLFSQSLRLQGQYRIGSQPVISALLKMGQSTEKIVIRDNKNTSRNLTASLEYKIKKTSITGIYTLLQDEFSNPNRNGFLNRVYQDALLTPISFDNGQNLPQAYSTGVDNPVYLLTDNGNRFLQTHQTGSLVLEKKESKFKYKVTQSIEQLNQQAREGYKPGSAFFPGGIAIDRSRKDRNYLLEGNASYDFNFNMYRYTGSVKAHYSYTDSRSGIDYSLPADYHYQRSAHDASLVYYLDYHGYGHRFDAGINMGAKAYASNTTTTDNYFLPNAAAYLKCDNIPGLENFYAKISGTYNRFNNELPIGRSFSQNSLLQYTTEQVFQFFPVTEVHSFDNLKAVRHTEYTGRLEISYKYRVTIYSELFNRKTRDDIFPVFTNGNLVLENLASHRNKGFELGAIVSHRRRNFFTENTVSFFRYNSRITDVKDGYDGTPMAGFANIHTAIVKGAPLGSIVGTEYLRDASNHILTGNDGFPVVDPTLRVIGNPIPDFTMKMANSFNWKMLYLDLAWEWKQGGQLWNGTQAVLDYYGRSARSAAWRNSADNHRMRYGPGGVGAGYIQRADVLRLHSVAVSYKQRLKRYPQQLAISCYANNLLLHSSYKGADPNQLLYDQPNAIGLDFFNLPSVKSFGCNISLQF